MSGQQQSWTDRLVAAQVALEAVFSLDQDLLAEALIHRGEDDVGMLYEAAHAAMQDLRGNSYQLVVDVTGSRRLVASAAYVDASTQTPKPCPKQPPQVSQLRAGTTGAASS